MRLNRCRSLRRKCQAFVLEYSEPNIYGGGVEYTDVKAYATPNGAFFSTDWSSETEFSVGDGKFVTERSLGFNANKSNATYSDSVSTVQVSAVFGQYLIRYC